MLCIIYCQKCEKSAHIQKSLLLECFTVTRLFHFLLMSNIYVFGGFNSDSVHNYNIPHETLTCRLQLQILNI